MASPGLEEGKVLAVRPGYPDKNGQDQERVVRSSASQVGVTGGSAVGHLGAICRQTCSLNPRSLVLTIVLTYLHAPAIHYEHALGLINLADCVLLVAGAVAADTSSLSLLNLHGEFNMQRLRTGVYPRHYTCCISYIIHCSCRTALTEAGYLQIYSCH